MFNKSAYFDKKFAKLLQSYGVFFAFSIEQFNNKKKPNTEYVRLSDGTCCPKDELENYYKSLNEISNEAIELDKKLNSEADIILRELINFECFYTCDITDAHDALKAYNYSLEKVQEIFDKNTHLID